MKYSIMCASAIKPSLLRLIVDVNTNDGEFEESAEIAVDISKMFLEDGVTLDLVALEKEVEKQVSRLNRTIDAATQVNEHNWTTNTVEPSPVADTVINGFNLAYGENR